MGRVDDDSIGDCLGALRRRRGLTQEQLAERADVALSTLRKLERGERQSARVATLANLARALDVRTSDLFEPGAPEPVVTEPAQLELMHLRQVLTPGRTEASSATEAPDLERLAQTYRSVERLQRTNQYGQAARLIPDVITQARRAVRDVDESERPRAYELLCCVLHVTGLLLTQMRQYDLAYFPTREAIDIAEGQEQELTAASGVGALAWLFMRQGRLTEAEEAAVAAAQSIEPHMSRATPGEMATWGWLLLYASSSAIRNNREADASEWLRLAEVAAANVGGVGHPEGGWAVLTPWFDRVTVGRRKVEHAVIRGETREALRMSEGIAANDAPTSVNRNRHLLDLASAYCSERDYGEALDVLGGIRREVPEWLQHQRYARDITSRLLESRKRTVSDEMRGLADFLAVE